jgi:hypothetical protein
MHVLSASYFGEGCDDMHALAHVASAHVERQSMSAVHAVSVSHAVSSALQNEVTQLPHAAPPSSPPSLPPSGGGGGGPASGGGGPPHAAPHVVSMHVMNGPNVGEWYFETHPSAHVESLHVITQSIVAVHVGSAEHAPSDVEHDEPMHALHGSLPSPSAPSNGSVRPVSSLGDPESNDRDESNDDAPESSSGVDVSMCVPESSVGRESYPGPVSW